MNTKLCLGCNKEKSLDYFHRKAAAKDGYRTKCKECRTKFNQENYEKQSAERKSFYKKHRDKLLNNVKKSYIKNKTKISNKNKLKTLIKNKIIPENSHEFPKDILSGTHRGCFQCKKIKKNSCFNGQKGYICIKCQKTSRKDYRKINAPIIRKKQKEYREKNKEILKISQKISLEKHKHKYKERAKAYRASEQGKMKRKKYRDNIQVKIAERLRQHVRTAVKNFRMNKKFHTLDYLGCDILYFIGWIKCQFTEDMSERLWKEGAIHLDHFKPLCSYDLTKEEEVKKAFHYTNIRPLLASENCSKATQDKLMKKV